MNMLAELSKRLRQMNAPCRGTFIEGGASRLAAYILYLSSENESDDVGLDITKDSSQASLERYPRLSRGYSER